MSEHTGHSVTRIQGRLVVHHDGTIYFVIKNPREIEKRGTKMILKITNAGHIPYLAGGISMEIDCGKVGLDIIEEPNNEADSVERYRRAGTR